MYYLAAKNPNGTYIIDEIVADWHDGVDGYEPIDCINGEMLIFDDEGNKYFVGPDKSLEEKKITESISVVDVGAWNFENGEPFLISLGERNKPELDAMLESYNTATS